MIGALDGCHLEIECTQEKVDDLSYQNYHQWYSIVLMVSNVKCGYSLNVAGLGVVGRMIFKYFFNF